MQGTIKVEVKLFLEMDVDEETVAEIIENMDYNFKHKLIADTEIVDAE